MNSEHIVAGLKAAGEPTRLRLLVVLAHTELTVSELTRVLGQSQPRISRHLKLLCDADLLERFQEGAWVFYRLTRSRDGVPNIAEAVLSFIDVNDPAMARDLERLESVKEVRREEAANYFANVAGAWEKLRSLHTSDQQVEETMLQLVGEGTIANYLDIGTGTGRMLEVFGPQTEKGIGVDLSHEMLAIARTRIEAAGLDHCQVRQGDLFALDLANGSGATNGHMDNADLITLHLVLHYLTDPAAAVAEAVRALKPTGKLLIADFAPHDLEELREEHSHRRLGFSDTEVAGWCKAAGLHHIKISHLPPPDENGRKLTVTLWLAQASAQPGQQV